MFYIGDTIETINLDRALDVDTEAGEFISIMHKSTGSSLQLGGKSSIQGLRKGWNILSVQSKPYSTQPSAIKNVLEAEDFGHGPTGLKVFNTESRFLSKFGITDEPYEYTKLVNLMHRTKARESSKFSSVRQSNQLLFIAPSNGDDVITAPGGEKANIKVRSYPSAFHSDLGFSRLNLKIALQNTSGSSYVHRTAQINKLRFTVDYV